MILSEMERADVLVRHTFICSVSSQKPAKRLIEHVRQMSGTTFPIRWPRGWIFTYRNFLRQGTFGRLNIKDLEKKYLCCDKFLIPVGTVSNGEEALTSGNVFILLLSEGGRVYVHDKNCDSVQLISRTGFHSLLTEGLMKYPPLREKLGPVRYSFGDSLALEFEIPTDLMGVWRLCQRNAGKEFSWTCTENIYLAEVVEGERTYENPAHQEWIKDTGSVNVLHIFVLSMLWRQKLIDIPIVVNEQLRVFAVNPDTKRVEYLASSLPAFFRVGVLRLGNQQYFCRQCVRHKKHCNIPPAYLCNTCPREPFCRKQTRSQKQKGRFFCPGSKHVSDE
ncbi:Cy69 [Cynomolgus cytomegalovirus]|uniref:Protein UL43 n=1 Tax=Cynomolgus macaque cytomegalovirus strain Mauritius TaxID=1690255 RepID=A0A0K1GZR0_9BETA|nr:Cy69 [Cynomolgus cytomegalovirus]AKT72703.1 protein UL43 [Cynomolgus macaque cytomegalovirus strain Mauritius]AXG21763.1 protein UL48 [synthetic construct]APT39331.1 Cy69 [Cynomolgus cytomegalovirus]APT39444.1 Cy69 [Cynomolgus cytomegalovirus]APT39617.1 Cy69 [Cynomolgus cytomegalovirus]